LESEASTAEPETVEHLPLLGLVPEHDLVDRTQTALGGEDAANEFAQNMNVIVENTYEMYDPGRRSRQVLEMSNKVVHIRPLKRVPKTLSISAVKALPSDGSSDPSSRNSSPRSSSVNEFPISVGHVSSIESAHELATHWGVFVGKLIFARISPLNTVAYKTITRSQRLKQQSIGVRTGVKGRARKVVEQAKLLAGKVIKQDEDLLDSEWGENCLLKLLFGSEYVGTLMILAKAARHVLATQPALAETSAPCRIFGDIHGQLRDLLFLFSAFGSPGDSLELSYVFNGDFVDRGSHQIEVVGLLFALKVLMPDKVWLVRGNHEDRSMNEKYGFKETCCKQLGKEFGLTAYEFFEEAFDQLPIACLVSDSILCVHGGIGDGRWDLNDVRAVRRPLGAKELANPDNKWILDILWSDPIEDDQSEGACVFGVHPSDRTESAHLFGWNVTKTFCARNGLGLVVRSHQSKQDSPGFDVMHDNMLIRVFSARDYEGHGNDGAVLLVTPSMDENCKEILTVQPQVLQSVTRAHEEGLAGLPKRRSVGLKQQSGCSTVQLSPMWVKAEVKKRSSGVASAPVPHLRLAKTHTSTVCHSLTV